MQLFMKKYHFNFYVNLYNYIYKIGVPETKEPKGEKVMKAKKIVSVFCAMAVIMGTMTGFAGVEVQAAKKDKKAADDLSEHVEITLGGINSGDSSEDWPTENLKMLEEKFNVTFKAQGYDNESLNLDLSGGTTCDIIQVTDSHIAGVLKGKHAVNLEDYKDIAPNIFSDRMQFRNDVMKTFKSDKKGGQYFVTPRVNIGDLSVNYGTRLNNGYVVRWDLYKEIGCPEINNDDDYIKALKAMKEIYPETEDGLPVYAMSPYNDAGLHPYFMKGCVTEGYMYLNGGLYAQNVETNELVSDVYDVENPDVVTPFWSSMEFYNRLYKEGLLDPDAFIATQSDLSEKYEKEQYLGGTSDWLFSSHNTNARKEDSETLKQYVILPAKMGWANENHAAGWAGKYFFVSSHSKNIERAVMILDYLQSPEFSRAVDSGVEGRWEAGEDGKPALTDDTINMKEDGSRTDEWKATGIGEGNLNCFVGESSYNRLDDGGLVNLWLEDDMLNRGLTAAEKDMCETLDLTIPSDVLKNHVEAGTSTDFRNCNMAIQMALEVTPKDIVRIDTNCAEIAVNAVPSLIQAETEEDFQAAKADLMEQLKGAGIEDSVKWWMEAWDNAKTGIEELQK
mgnify:CR=1 FL=1